MLLRDEQTLRRQLVEYGKKLLETGLVQGTWGNLSARLDEKNMLVTPSGIDYERLTPDDIVKVEIRTLKHEDGLKPTSEKMLHAGAYLQRPEAGAVIHTHSKYCSIFAAARMPLQIEDPETMERLGEIIKISDHALAGTKKLAKNVLKALGKESPGVIMAHHGMICVGRDLADAFEICCMIEGAAKAYIDKRWDK